MSDKLLWRLVKQVYESENNGELVEEAIVEIERLRAQLEYLAGCMAQIERAAAGSIYSQEMIHAMASDARRRIEVKEEKL
jgi:hypothetical protein